MEQNRAFRAHMFQARRNVFDASVLLHNVQIRVSVDSDRTLQIPVSTSSPQLVASFLSGSGIVLEAVEKNTHPGPHEVLNSIIAHALSLSVPHCGPEFV